MLTITRSDLGLQPKSESETTLEEELIIEDPESESDDDSKKYT